MEGGNFQYFFWPLGSQTKNYRDANNALTTIPNPTKKNFRTREKHGKKSFKQVSKNTHEYTLSIKNTVGDNFWKLFFHVFRMFLGCFSTFFRLF